MFPCSYMFYLGVFSVCLTTHHSPNLFSTLNENHPIQMQLKCFLHVLFIIIFTFIFQANHIFLNSFVYAYIYIYKILRITRFAKSYTI